MASTIDPHEATELELYIDHDSRFAMNSPEGIGHTTRMRLLKMVERGTYDSARAPKAWQYVVDTAAKKYKREFPTPDYDPVTFSAATRRFIAKRMAEDFENQYIREPVVISPNPKSNFGGWW